MNQKESINEPAKPGKTNMEFSLSDRSIVEKLPLAIMISTIKTGEIKFANNELTNLSGFSKKELIGSPAGDFYYNKSDRATLVKAIKEKGFISDFEVQAKRVDGTIIWISVSTKSLIYEGELSLISSFHNITTQRNAKQSLQQSQEKISSILQTVPDCIINLDREGIITYTNHRLPCLPNTDAVGTNFHDHIPPEFQQDFRNALENVYSDDIIVDLKTTRTEAESGVIKYYSNRIGPMKIDEEIIGIVISVTDITAITGSLIQAETKARELHQFIETANAPIFGIDTDGKINEWNQAAEKITLFSKKEVLGENLVERYITYDYRNSVQEVLTNALNGKETSNYEFPLYTKNNKKVMILLNSSTRRNTEDEIIGVLGVGQNITERVAGERKLIKAKKKAEIANHAKNTFIANMSHEIRTPMNAVLGFSDLLSLTVTDEKQKNYITSIQNAGKTLLQLIDDILDLSKIEADQMSITPEPVNISNVIDEVTQIFKQSMEDKEIGFFIEKDVSLPPVLMIDQIRLRQILFNLIGNAIKFTDTGFVKLKISKQISKQDHSKIDLIITVEDTGIGIPSEQINSIFGSFVQLDGQSTRKFEGTGLGLAIIKRIMAKMNGDITVKSTLGKGSVFRVILKKIPIGSNAHLNNASDNILNTKSASFKHGRILIVDDNKSNREVMKESLALAGLESTCTDNGEDAITLANEVLPDLILMDLKMPGMNGYEAAEKILTNPETGHIPIIALTASASKEGAQKANDTGFTGYYQKPVRIQALLNELKQHLDSSEKNKRSKPYIANNHQSKTNNNECMKDFEELKIKLEKIMPECNKLQGTLEIPLIDTFSHKIFELGQLHNSDDLKEYAKNLSKYSDQVNVEKIVTQLKMISDVCKGILKSSDPAMNC